MFDKKVFFLMIASTVLIFAGAVFVIGPSSKSTPTLTENAIAYTLDPTSFDWGNISFDGEIATKEFRIKNNGNDILKFYNIRTSCHCTKAQIVVGEEGSPYFGMSGVSSWTGEVEPGKEAKLIVKFDQRYHGPQGVGPITRFVSVKTNDKATPELTFTLTGTVVKK